MAKRLKAVIIGLHNVLIREGLLDKQIFSEIHRLVNFLKSRYITPIFFGNQNWFVNSGSGQRQIQEVVTELWGEYDWIITLRDGTPPKPRAAAVQYILDRYGLDSAEVVYIGNTPEDMQTAVNSKVLFLNATWYGQNTDYGFSFETPQDIARFIDTFCLRTNLWHYTIESDLLRYYAIAPYSTKISEYAVMSNDARDAAKFGGGHPDFWTKYLWSTIYFAELHKHVDYIAVCPSHEQGSGNTIMAEPMRAFGKCFRIPYLGDFVERHTTAQKLQTARRNRQAVDHMVPLNTIKLNPSPTKSNNEPYAKCPVKKEKLVLLIDDFCTNGLTLDSARVFIEQTGAKVVCLSWGKTINSDYQCIRSIDSFDPFSSQVFSSSPEIVRFPYRDFLVEEWAHGELDKKLRAYDRWSWPTGI